MDTQNQNPTILDPKEEAALDTEYGGKIILADPQLPEYYMTSLYFAGFEDLNDINRKTFLSSFMNLPLPIKNYITSPETAFLLNDIRKENNLSFSQISLTAATLRDLVLGQIFIKDFPNVLSSKLQLEDPAIANNIADKIISKSFSSIIEDVKRIQRSKFPDRIMQLQKEGRPTSLNQNQPVPGFKKEEPKNEIKTPAAPTLQMNQERVRPPAPPPQFKPPAENLPLNPGQTLRPPEPQSKVPFAPPQPSPKPSVQDIQPPKQEPTRPENSAPEISPQKPTFKIPDLDSLSGLPSQPKEGKPLSDAQKSLEEELQKVASVIDLRNKPEN